MPKPPKRTDPAALFPSLVGGMYIEMRKSRIGAYLLVGGVLSLAEISDTAVLIRSHHGALSVFGERLTVSTLKNRTLTVYGRITAVSLGYGREEKPLTEKL